jgi:hypothetical protein
LLGAAELNVGEVAGDFNRFALLLERCVADGFGVYVTF